jgi:hypothetical protein
MRKLVYIGVLLAALSGSFFLTPWWLDDGRDSSVDASDTRSDSERLASQRVTDYSELRRAAGKAGLRPSLDMIGTIEGYSRVNERDVTISGWLADPEGDANPLKVMVFVAGSVAGMTETNGERAEVTRLKGLAFGTEKNVVFGVAFPCQAGQQPVVVGLGIRRQYFPLVLRPCP